MKTRAKRLFTVTDLGGGDGGKGGVVHKIASAMYAQVVMKVGGAQGSHGVRTSHGERFAFSQFGCGTFEGVPTYISPLMVIDPIGILNEGEALRREWRMRNVFDLMTIDEDALSITPYHGIASRLRELARKDMPRGTVGVGVGEAYLDAERSPDLAIYARDLSHAKLREKIEAVRDQKIRELAPVIEEGFAPADEAIAQEEIRLLHHPRMIDYAYDQFRACSNAVAVVTRDYLRKRLLTRDGTIVVESSHGILTDRYYGFHPHTSKLRTLPHRIHDLVRECGYDGEIFKLGVTRAYQIRHGAGPMVTADPSMGESLLPGSNKDENRWQGKVRVGPLDFVALRYAIEVCGGPSAFDGIALSWFDQIRTNGVWKTCDRYSGAKPEFFSSPREIIVRRGEDEVQLERQARLANVLNACRPEISSEVIDASMGDEQIVAHCDEVLRSKLGVPLRMLSLGPTEREKVCI